MLLTLYYGLTTWIQSRRLSSIQAGIKNIYDYNCSIVMILEDRMTQGESKCGLIIHQDGVSSQCCKNRSDARIGDLLWFSRSKLCFTIFPKQIIEITSWINFDFEKPFFPIEIASNSHFTPEVINSARILIEAAYYENNCSDCTLCEIHQFGVPMVWRADTKFYMILETDLEHLAKLAYNFKMNHLVIDEFLIILRIESVETEGQPCLLLDADCTHDLQYSSPREVKTFEDTDSVTNSKLEHLKGLSLAAAEAVTSCQHVFAPDRTYRVIVPANTKVSKQLSVTEQSSDSFISCVQDLESVSSYHKDLESQDEEATQVASPQDSKSSDSFVSAGSASTVSLVSHTVENRVQSTVQQVKCLSTKLSVQQIGKTNPTNVVVYSESAVTLENVKAVLQETLNSHRYIIYGMSETQLTLQPWASKTSLLVVCGNVPAQLASLFISFLLDGGKMLCLCSDLLHLVLPSFRTAEVREKELVCFSYGKWKQVHLMHHIFCYHASPARAHFSDTLPRLNAPKTPPSVEVLDSNNKAHTLHVEVLGAEETWHSPSLLLATVETSKGKVIFSQVHLEVNPGQYEVEDSNYAVLQKSNATRLEILRDILSVHLDLDCTKACPPCFTPAFFLGRHELKLALLQELKLQSGNMLSLPKMSLQFCGKDVTPAAATETFIPVYIHACPANFSTVEYFENLDSETIGRLVLYSEVLASCMDVLHSGVFQHGMAVVAREQTRGKGRGENVWLCPKGCAIFSLQLHIGLQSYVAQHISLLQHIVSLALVSGINSISGYEVLNLKLKWPNDIYIGNEMKLGGVVIKTSLEDSSVVCNIGCALNLDNASPTICINDLIRKHNKEKKQNIPLLSYEKLLAFTFTKLETLLAQVEVDVSSIINMYYSYWLHSNAEVLLMDSNNSVQNVTVEGIDQSGFLSVKTESGSCFTVHPDNNSFDIISGLITPKCF